MLTAPKQRLLLSQFLTQILSFRAKVMRHAKPSSPFAAPACRTIYKLRDRCRLDMVETRRSAVDRQSSDAESESLPRLNLQLFVILIRRAPCRHPSIHRQLYKLSGGKILG